jgi:hypothetical protein
MMYSESGISGNFCKTLFIAVLILSDDYSGPN